MYLKEREEHTQKHKNIITDDGLYKLNVNMYQVFLLCIHILI